MGGGVCPKPSQVGLVGAHRRLGSLVHHPVHHPLEALQALVLMLESTLAAVAAPSSVPCGAEQAGSRGGGRRGVGCPPGIAAAVVGRLGPGSHRRRRLFPRRGKKAMRPGPTLPSTAAMAPIQLSTSSHPS